LAIGVTGSIIGDVFLPPDYNPIEKTWTHMKKELRSTAPLHGLIETAEAVPKLQLWNSNLRFNRKSGL
jgi:transposase